MPEQNCPKCDAVLGDAAMKCPLCGTPTRRGAVRHRLLRVRWYALLVTVLGFVCLVIARGEPGKFLGMTAIVAGCAAYVAARYVDQQLRK